MNYDVQINCLASFINHNALESQQIILLYQWQMQC